MTRTRPVQPRPQPKPRRGTPGWVVASGLVLALLAVLWVGGLVLGVIGTLVGLAVKLVAGAALVALAWVGGRRMLSGATSRGEVGP